MTVTDHANEGVCKVLHEMSEEENRLAQRLQHQFLESTDQTELETPKVDAE